MQSLAAKPVLDPLRLDLKRRSAALIDRGIDVHLAVVMAGEDPQAARYVGKKQEAAEASGIELSLYALEAPALSDMRGILEYLADDGSVDGTVLQLPLPGSADPQPLLSLIPERQDVDGLAAAWQDRSYPDLRPAALAAASPMLPPMILAVMSLLASGGIDPRAKKIGMVGKGRLVGAPLLAFCERAGLDAFSVDEETPEILSRTREADILITGTGQPDLVTYQWIKEGAVVIDASGDVHHGSVDQIASAVSPAVGGVGPLTVHWLLSNVLASAERRAS